MWNKEKIFAYACKQRVELELQKAIDSYRQGDTEQVLKWLFENRIEQIQKGEYWEGNINDLQNSIQLKIKEYKIPLFIGFDGGDNYFRPCAIISIIQHGCMNVIDNITSASKLDVKKKIEEYDKDYFSLDSIAKRRRQEMNMR